MADTRAFEQSCDEADKLVLDILVQNMELTLDHVAGKAKEKVGVGTGALRADTRSLGVEIVGDEVHGSVGNSLEHAIYHHQGTGIYAVNGDGRKTPWVYEDPKTGKKFTLEAQNQILTLKIRLIRNKALYQNCLEVLTNATRLSSQTTD